MRMSDAKNEMLDDILATARGQIAAPSSELMARVLADAAAHQSIAGDSVTSPSRGTWLSGLMANLGGWPAMSGVAAAGVAGLWLGIAPPSSVESWTADLMGTTTAVTFMDDYDLIGAWESADG